jgi:integrase
LVRRQRLRDLTDARVAALKPRARTYVERDPQLPGHYVRVQPKSKSFYVVRRIDGKLRWVKLGATTELTVEASREKAKAVLTRLREGQEPFPEPPTPTPKPESVTAVAEDWYARRVKSGVRTANQIRRLLDRFILPELGKREFASIRRSDIAKLLDRVEDAHGPRIADYVLVVLRAIANWYATRHDDYVAPFVKGMRRTSKEERKPRKRTLNDDELRSVWHAAESADAGAFGGLIRVALLTAQRREVLLRMRWHDIDDEGIWHIPVEDERAKGHGCDLRLPQMALDIIRAQPRFVGNDYVFAGNRGIMGNMSRRKRCLDEQSGVYNWRIHDCRRTARTLLTRAGVPTEHAERVLGHARERIEATYNTHPYLEEKSAALQRLATLVERIVNPPADNVVPLTAAHS